MIDFLLKKLGKMMFGDFCEDIIARLDRIEATVDRMIKTLDEK